MAPKADIRSFFGGGPPKEKTAAKKPDSPVKPKRGKRKVIEDSDDDDPPPTKKATPKKPAAKKAQKPDSPKGEEISSSDYFGGKNKPTRTSVVQPAATVKTPQQSPAKTKSATNSTRSTRTSGRNGAAKSYVELDADDDGLKMARDDNDSGEDVFEAEYKGRGKKREDDYEEDDDDDDDIDIAPPTKAKTTKAKATNGRKRKSPDPDEEDEEPPKKKKPAAKKAISQATPKKTKAKKTDEPEDAKIQDIFDSIQQVKPPTPPPRDADKKWDFKANAGRAQAQAANPGSVEIPAGAENCLAGLSFVFTGILEGLAREEGQSLVKQYGGKVMGAPSKKTSFVVLGSDAGPKKLETIHANNIRTIDEHGLFDLIRKLPANGGSGKAAADFAEKKAAEEAKAQKAAEEMAAEEARVAKEQKKVEAKALESGRPVQKKQRNLDEELWTVKYAPTQMTQICGNKGQVEKLQKWLQNWHRNAKKKFRVAGGDGSGIYRAAILSGGPGIGKTTSAHLVAKLEGYDVIETNASDTRSKKLVEQGLRGVLDTTSLLGYFSGDGKKVEETKKKIVLIMDEVDGMSAGDRGGVGALAAVCRKTSVPIILICNDRKLPKMRPFDGCTYGLPFHKPTTDQVRGRIMTILFREGMKDLIPKNVVDALIEGTNADIRQIINMISTAKLDQQAMGFEQGKKMASAWEKNTILKPWDITHKILGSGMFAPSSRATLNDKIELYFNDHEFSSLMLQENYLNHRPAAANSYTGREHTLKTLEMFDKAAESISDGDLVDRMIHGNQQQWSLMPTHAVFSFVRPASFVAGPSNKQTRFTNYLGNLSKTGKFARFVKEIQGHMRLRASADRHDIRQQYMPLLWQRLIKSLELNGSEPGGIDEVIELMDSYYLTKEDWDAILELGVGKCAQEAVSIPTQVKSNFTRKYNAMSHPLPFMKAGGTAPPIQKGPKEKPDLEEALEASDEEEALVDPAAEDGSESEELDLKKDKYVRAPKKKKAPAKKAAGKGKKKAQDEDLEDDEDEEEDVKPKARSKAKPAGKAKGKK